MDDKQVNELAKVLGKQIDKEIFDKKYAPAAVILKLVGMGVFLTASVVMPNLPLALKPFINKKRKAEYEAWKRFNIPYLKRTIQRLEKQKMVEISEAEGLQVVKITNQGKEKIVKMALDELAIEKPKVWDNRWRLVSFDLPEKLSRKRRVLVEYLKAWGFYPLHESVYLHAYPCYKQVDFLRVYLRVNEYVRVFIVEKIEDDQLFKDFFGL